MSANTLLLGEIHRGTLDTFRYVTDAEQFKCSDHWMSPNELCTQIKACGLTIGDCDDFASMCVMKCREQGLPARFVFCQVETGEYHLVAEVEGWILDNRQQTIQSRDDLPYKWMAVSGYNKGDAWHLIIS